MGIAAYNRGSAMMRRENDAAAVRQREREIGRRNVEVVATKARPARDACHGTDFDIGDRVFCVIPAVRGWYTVRTIAGSGARQRLKIEGFAPWCPATNFRREDHNA